MNWRANVSLADYRKDILCNNALHCLISVSVHTYTSHLQLEPQVSNLFRLLTAIRTVTHQYGNSDWLGDCINRLCGCIKHGRSLDDPHDVCFFRLLLFGFHLFVDYWPEIHMYSDKILINNFLSITHMSPSLPKCPSLLSRSFSSFLFLLFERTTSALPSCQMHLAWVSNNC